MIDALHHRRNVVDPNIASHPLCTTQETAPYGSCYQHGWTFTTYVVEAAHYLPYLQQRFTELGGSIITRRVQSLHGDAMDDLRADVVVNCGGLMGGVDLAHDPHCYPIRGQVVWVDAPWVQQYVCGDGFYAIPNRRHLVCGGISQKGDWTTATRDEEVAYIMEGVGRFLPSIKVCACAHTHIPDVRCFALRWQHRAMCVHH